MSELETANRVSYLPHQAVCRDNVETTKVRIVYDASCKERKTGTSLNDCLHKGPPLTPLIFDILLRFRADRVALVGDIEKAFLNIEIHPQDRDCLRFLWVKDINDQQSEKIVFRFNRVVFGVSSSPFLLNAVIRYHLQQYQEIDPDFVRRMQEGFFVDDLVTSCQGTEEAFEIYEKARSRMMEGGFKLRKFKTNNIALGEKIVKNEKEIKTSKSTEDEASYAQETLGLSKEMGGKTKVLGIPWDIERDSIEFDLGKVTQAPLNVATKRGILSTMATLFDPLGLVSPIAVTAKVLFQELCLEKLSWDDALSEDQVRRWESWLYDLKSVDKISLPRCTLESVEGEVISTTLHGFGDASKCAYCALIYVVYKTRKGTYTKLLCAKTRVAPLKTLSIPRLELMAARILATLMGTVKTALSTQIKVDSIKFWIDSKTALYWIYNQGEWKNFVQHRVNEILKLTNKEDWEHVSGKDNPADIGSRGATASQLRDSQLWWFGPYWLQKGEIEWPIKPTPEESEDVDEERKKARVMVSIATKQERVSNVINGERYSTLERLLHVTAYVRRFIENMKKRKEGKEIKLDELSVEEIRGAEKILIEDAQQTLKSDSKFEKLNIIYFLLKPL